MALHDRSDDFGVTALGGGRFVLAWASHFGSPVEVLEQVVAEEEAAGLEQYVIDAALLVESPLDAGQLEELWMAAVSGRRRPSQDGYDGRAWFARIIEVLRPALARAGQVPDTDGALDHRVDVIGEVVAIVRRLTVRRDYGPGSVDAERLRGALVDLAAGGCPELALRFFISAAMTYDSALDEELYSDVRRAGGHFGYGRFITERLELLLPG